MGKCKQCGKNCEGDYCFSHKPRKILAQRNFVYRTNKVGEQMINKAMKMHLFFYEIWKKRPHKSEVSGEYLGKEYLSVLFHHILPKSKYPDLAYVEENIVLLTIDEHANVESDIYKYEEVNKRRDLLKKKYKL